MTFISTVAAIGLAVVVAGGSAAAAADSISFGDYFFPGDHLPDGFGSMTDRHVSFTVSGSQTGFDVATEGGAYNGQFIHNTTLIYDSAPGTVTITFASPIDGIGDLAIQPNDPGAYFATLTAYDGLAEVGSQTFQGFNAPGPEGSIAYFFVGSPAITSITLTTTNDADGIAIGGGIGIPEPASWALMVIGMGLVGSRLRRRATVFT